MDVSKYDRNFAVQYNLPEELMWQDATVAPVQLHGVYRSENGSLHRLPAETVADIGSKGYEHFEVCTAGGRLRFRTDSKIVALRVEVTDDILMPDMPLTGSSGCDVYIGDTHQRFAAFLFPHKQDQHVYVGSFSSESTETVTVYLPLYNGIRSIAIGLMPDAGLWAPVPYAVSKPIVFYGSSITQGACASRPSLTYSALLSRWLNADFINLGFSGSAAGEPKMAQYIADLDMSACVLEYDYNAPHAEHLQQTYQPFVQVLRTAHPTLPLIGMSRLNHKHYPEESKQRRRAIAKVYEHLQKDGDDKAWFIDGETILGDHGWEDAITGRCHPNDIGFLRMAEAILPYLKRR